MFFRIIERIRNFPTSIRNALASVKTFNHNLVASAKIYRLIQSHIELSIVRDRYPDLYTALVPSTYLDMEQIPMEFVLKERLSEQLTPIQEVVSSVDRIIAREVLSYAWQQEDIIPLYKRISGYPTCSVKDVARILISLKSKGVSCESMEEICTDYVAKPGVWRPNEQLIASGWAVSLGVLAKTKNPMLPRLLALHKKKFRNKGIERDIFASDILVKSGIEHNAIAKSARLYREMIGNIENFKAFLKNKTIAIVGNGPQELGSNNGKKIDSYDVVIRFNAFDTSEKFKVDYGSKTNVWCLAASFVAPKRKNSEIDFYFEPSGMNRYLFSNEKLQFLDAMAESGRYITGTPESYLAEQNFLGNPTSGVLMIGYIKTIVPNLSFDDLFGFSFKRSKGSVASHYFDPRRVKKVPHSVAIDHDCIKKIFPEEIFQMDV